MRVKGLGDVNPIVFAGMSLEDFKKNYGMSGNYITFEPKEREKAIKEDYEAIMASIPKKPKEESKPKGE